MRDAINAGLDQLEGVIGDAVSSVLPTLPADVERTIWERLRDDPVQMRIYISGLAELHGGDVDGLLDEYMADQTAKFGE